MENDQHLENLMNTEDLLFVKALPVNEHQINMTNLHEFDIDEVFHKFNIDLMFTLEALTTEFSRNPVEKPVFDQPITVGQKRQIEHRVPEEVKVSVQSSYQKQQPLLEMSDQEVAAEVVSEHTGSSQLQHPVNQNGSINQKHSRSDSQSEVESSDQPVDEPDEGTPCLPYFRS